MLPKVIALTATAPEDTVKSVESKDATPLLLEVANSPEIVTTLLVIAVSIPSPPVNVRVSLMRETVSVPLSPAISSSVEIVVNATVPLPFVISA